MNAWEAALAITVLVLADVWLFWYAYRAERIEHERREAMRRKGNRSSTYK